MTGAADIPDDAAFIDARWDFDDPARAEAAFRALLAAMPPGRGPDFESQVRTQLARAVGLQRRFDEAHAELDRVEGAIGPESSLATARLLLERGRVLNSSGAEDAARPLFAAAWERACALGADFYAVDAAHMLAIVDDALAWNEKALALAERSKDERARGWEGSLLNNIGWTLHAAGDHARSLAMFERAHAARVGKGDDGAVRVAEWCIARCLRSLGRLDEALARQRGLLAQLEAAGGRDGFVHEEIAECLHALGRTGEARPHFALAHAILSEERWLAEAEPERLARLAALAGPDDGGEHASGA